MGRLTYSALASIDGYIEDSNGRFDWARPDEEVGRFVNELERPVGTFLYGRRMYETMVFWETVDLDGSEGDEVREWTKLWRAADKVVYSRTLRSATSARTRIERDFEPEAVRRLKESSSRDLSLGGANLAGQALRAGLVDELHWFAVPALVGGGKAWLPHDIRVKLELLEIRRFASGFVFFRYRPGGDVPSISESPT